LTTNQPVDTSGFTLAYNVGTNTATFSVNGILDDGNYRATLRPRAWLIPRAICWMATATAWAATNHNLAFFFLQGDANRDRSVDLLDFNILAANFGQSGRDFTQGDFNYTGNVDLVDFNILASVSATRSRQDRRRRSCSGRSACPTRRACRCAPISAAGRACSARPHRHASRARHRFDPYRPAGRPVRPAAHRLIWHERITLRRKEWPHDEFAQATGKRSLRTDRAADPDGCRSGE
jgi:hypothetical protein